MGKKILGAKSMESAEAGAESLTMSKCHFAGWCNQGKCEIMGDKVNG